MPEKLRNKRNVRKKINNQSVCYRKMRAKNTELRSVACRTDSDESTVWTGQDARTRLM